MASHSACGTRIVHKTAGDSTEHAPLTRSGPGLFLVDHRSGRTTCGLISGVPHYQRGMIKRTSLRKPVACTTTPKEIPAGFGRGLRSVPFQLHHRPPVDPTLWLVHVASLGAHGRYDWFLLHVGYQLFVDVCCSIIGFKAVMFIGNNMEGWKVYNIIMPIECYLVSDSTQGIDGSTYSTCLPVLFSR